MSLPSGDLAKATILQLYLYCIQVSEAGALPRGKQHAEVNLANSRIQRRGVLDRMMMMMMIVINVRGSKCHPEPPRGHEDVLGSEFIY